MALKEAAVWVIAYDIRCPRRLRRVHGYLKTEAIWLQYSVFATTADAQRLGTIRAALDELIDEKVDDVRIYRVPKSPSLVTIGQHGLPEGIALLASGSLAGLGSMTSTAGGGS